MKKLSLILLILSIVGFQKSYGAGERVAYDPDLDRNDKTNHLPKRLRSDAVRFYEKMEAQMKRVSRSEAALHLPYNLFVHMFRTPDWNIMAKPWHRFIDYCIRTDGINTPKETPAVLPATILGEAYDIDDIAEDGPAGLEGAAKEFYNDFHETFKFLADRRNPFGLFFLGLVQIRGIGVARNKDRGRHYLLMAAERDYPRAIKLLMNHHDPAYPEMPSLAVLKLRKDLLGDDSMETVQGFIEDADVKVARSLPRDTFLELERSLLANEGRVDQLFEFYNTLTDIIHGILAPMQRRVFSLKKLTSNAITDTALYAVPAVLTSMYLYSHQELNFTSFGGDLFEYKIIWYETLVGSTWGFGRLGYNLYPLISNNCCHCSWLCKGTIDPSVSMDAIASEARLSALYVTLLSADHINDDLTPIKAVDLKPRLSKVFSKHLDGTAKPMSKVVLEHWDDEV